MFDGSGAAPAEADVVIEDGRIVEVGSGLDGDEAIDCAGKALLPGLFDCHIHLAFRYEDFDEYARMQEPFSLAFFRMAQNLRLTLALGITSGRMKTAVGVAERDGPAVLLDSLRPLLAALA